MTICPASCLPMSHNQILQGRFRFSSCLLTTSDATTNTPTAVS
jgi:hypothetical protein